MFSHQMQFSRNKDVAFEFEYMVLCSIHTGSQDFENNKMKYLAFTKKMFNFAAKYIKRNRKWQLQSDQSLS